MNSFRLSVHWQMRARKPFVFLNAVPAIILLVSCSVALGNSTQWRKKFVSWAPSAWQKIDDLAKHLEAIVTDRRYYPDGRLAQQFEWHSKYSGEKCVQVRKSSNQDNSERERVLGWNEEYGFELGKNAQDRPWQVRFVGAEFHAKGLKKLEQAHNPARVQLFLGPSELPALLDSPSFRVTDVEPITAADGVTYVEVAFENSGPADSAEVAWPIRGKFTLAPDRLWALKDYDIEIKFKDGHVEQWAAVLDFRPSDEGLPLMREWVHTRKSKEFESGKWVWTYDRYLPIDLPDEDFTLTAFGLPEIHSPSIVAANRLWMYLTAAGVVLVVAGIVLRLRMKAQAARHG